MAGEAKETGAGRSICLGSRIRIRIHVRSRSRVSGCVFTPTSASPASMAQCWRSLLDQRITGSPGLLMPRAPSWVKHRPNRVGASTGLVSLDASVANWLRVITGDFSRPALIACLKTAV